MSGTDAGLQLASGDHARAMAVMSRDLIEPGLGWTYQPERIRRLLRDPDVTGVVIERAGQLAGFGMMSFGDEHTHLLLLAVRPAHQRCGLGRRIVAWLLASAAAAGAASVHVELRSSNRGAFAFYRALQFAETIRVAGYYRGAETAIRMLRLLRPPSRTSPRWQPPAPGRH
jgi:ribosomal protein S18 acetylase RimI-like enzyme